MNDATDLMIADLEISEISNSELEDAFRSVVAEHKDALVSIHGSMKEADEAYRKYLDPEYIPIEEMAKKDRAILNRAEKNIFEKYSGLREAYEKPLLSIEANIKSIRNAIKNASGVVDKAVKSYEDKRKSLKYQEIQIYFDNKEFDLVPLEKIFNEQWLNKGTKIKDIQQQIDEILTDIYRDIEVLERIPEYGMAVKAFYLDTLDMGAAIHRADMLRENAERLVREQAAREARKVSEQVIQNGTAEQQEQQILNKGQQIADLAKEALDLPDDLPMAEKSELLEYTLRFKGTREQLLKLREYMTNLGISYEKGNVFDAYEQADGWRVGNKLNKSIYQVIFTANGCENK